MSDETEKEVIRFVGKYARSYIAYPHLLQTVLGLGDEMFEDYENLSDAAKSRTCEWCANIISNHFHPNKLPPPALEGEPKMSEHKEPDGFMCWHPNYGFDLTSIAHNENLVAANWVHAEFRTFPAECKTDRGKWEHVEAIGWKIKPVWISETPPALEKGEEK